MVKVKPATEVGKANGKSTAASKYFFPKNLYRVSTHVIIKPKIVLINAAKKAIFKVNIYAETAIGSSALSKIWSQLFVKRINNKALSGKINKKKIYVLKKIIEIIGELENELLIFSTVLNRLIL